MPVFRRLISRIKMDMKGLVFTQHSAGVPGSGLYVDGYLQLRQLNPINDKSVSPHPAPAAEDDTPCN